MNNFIEAIFEWFKRTFGTDYEKKKPQELATDFNRVSEISVTSVLAQRLATLTLTDASVTVAGENERAKYLDDFLDNLFNTKMETIAETCLGTGDCIVKPNTDGYRFGIDIIKNSDFRIVESVGDFIYSIIIKCDEKKIDNELYERFELHKLTEDAEGTSYVSIKQVVFKNGKRIEGAQIPEKWQELEEEQTIPNVDRLLLGRFKCPRLNRDDVNSPNGVPITYGNEEIVEEVKKSWRRYNQEFENMEAMIFADKSVFKAKKVRKSENGEAVTETVSVLPKGKERVIMDVNGARNVDAQPLIKEFAPAIRDTSLENGIETNLKMLELFCGFDGGILSKADAVYQNTDAIRKSIQNTFAFITGFRKILEAGVKDLAYAIDVLCNANEITPMGDYELTIDWSDEFAQSYSERFNELLQSLSLGAISKAEFRSWVMGEDLDIAQDAIEEITATLKKEQMDAMDLSDKGEDDGEPIEE